MRCPSVSRLAMSKRSRRKRSERSEAVGLRPPRDLSPPRHLVWRTSNEAHTRQCRADAQLLEANSPSRGTPGSDAQ